jgi:hypothetical protein
MIAHTEIDLVLGTGRGEKVYKILVIIIPTERTSDFGTFVLNNYNV